MRTLASTITHVRLPHVRLPHVRLPNLDLTHVDLTRTNRQTPSVLSVMTKMIGALWVASFLAGTTGDVWLSAMVAIGYPAAWAVAWLISE